MLALAMNDPQADRIAHQIQLELLFNKNQTLPRIRKEFETCKEFDFGAHMIEHGIPLPFGFDVLAQMALHKRTTLPTLIGILRHHFNDSQLTADMLWKAVEADLLDWATDLRICVVRYTISDDLQRELDMFQYPLPMVVEPKTITTNSETGYLMSGGSVILKKNHHDDDVCLDHLNRANKIKFSVDLDTATMVKNQWKNLDKPKSGETREDFEKRKRAFDKYQRTADEVINLLVKEGNEFYLTHKYDKRGRTYCQGYHISYQSAPWNKAIMLLADEEYIE